MSHKPSDTKHPHHRGDCLDDDSDPPTYAEIAGALLSLLNEAIDSKAPPKVDAVCRLAEAAAVIQVFDQRGRAMDPKEEEGNE